MADFSGLNNRVYLEGGTSATGPYVVNFEGTVALIFYAKGVR
jgi:hypothetical protein